MLKLEIIFHINFFFELHRDDSAISVIKNKYHVQNFYELLEYMRSSVCINESNFLVRTDYFIQIRNRLQNAPHQSREYHI